MDKNKIIICTVTGGVTEIIHQPEDIEIIIVDYDNLEDGIDVYCPVCGEFFEEWSDDGICAECGFDTSDPLSMLEE